MVSHKSIFPIRVDLSRCLGLLALTCFCAAGGCKSSTKNSRLADAAQAGGAAGLPGTGAGGSPGLGGTASVQQSGGATGKGGEPGGSGGQTASGGIGGGKPENGGAGGDLVGLDSGEPEVDEPVDAEGASGGGAGRAGLGGTGGIPGRGGTSSSGGRGGAGGVAGTGGGGGTYTCAARGDSCANLDCCSGYDYCQTVTHTCTKACGLIGDSCSYVYGCCTSAAQCDNSTNICGPPHVSDRNAKRDFSPADPDAILEKLSKLPISTWTYKTDESRARHIGPMAQDFMAAFQVGTSDKTIFQIDGDGIAFAAIQSLNEQLKRLRLENADLRREVAKIRTEMSRAARVPRSGVGR